MIWKLIVGNAVRTIKPTEQPKLKIAFENGEAFRRAKLEGNLLLTGADYTFLMQNKAELGCCSAVILQAFENCGGELKIAAEAQTPTGALEWDYDECSVATTKLETVDPYAKVFAAWETPINLMNFPLIAPFESTQRDVPPSEYNPKSSRMHRGRVLLPLVRWLWFHTLKDSPELQDQGTPLEQTSSIMFDDIDPLDGSQNIMKRIVLEHLADCKRPGASNPSTIAKRSLKWLLETLKTVFNIYWMIEPTGNPDHPYILRLEHKKFFDGKTYGVIDTTLDLTADEYKKRVTQKRKVSTEYDSLYGLESFSLPANGLTAPQGTANNGKTDVTYRRQWGTSGGRGKDQGGGGLTPEQNFRFESSDEFASAVLTYDKDCAPKDEKGERLKSDSAAGDIVTNFNNVVLRPDEYPDDGFLFVEVEPHPTDASLSRTKSNPVFLSKKGYINGNLAATNLFYKYHRYDRSFVFGALSVDRSPENSGVAPTATLPEIPTRRIANFSVKPIAKLSEIKLSGCNCLDIDISGYVKTWFGSGGICQSLEKDLETGEITLTILHTDSCLQGEIPTEPGVVCQECPPYNTFLRSKSYQNFCGDGVTVMTNFYDVYYSTGECDESGKCTEYVVNQNRRTGKC